MNDDLNRIFEEINNRPIDDLDGISPTQMHHLLYDTFGQNSPLELRTIGESDYLRIPIFNQVQYLSQLIANNKEIRLTQKGFLPVSIVADIYSQGYMKDEHIESGISKLYKETDSIVIHLPRILIELMGIVKKRNGRLSLTKKAEKIINNKPEMLWLLFDTFANKFNWAYFDGYGQNPIGQFGIGFTLTLLSKYGNQPNPESFYAKKYFTAFPELMLTIESNEYNTHEYQALRCYALRTFSRFLDFFGIIRIDSKKPFEENADVSKTELFDKLLVLHST